MTTNGRKAGGLRTTGRFATFISGTEKSALPDIPAMTNRTKRKPRKTGMVGEQMTNGSAERVLAN